MADGIATADAPAAPVAKKEPVTHTLTCKTDQSVKQVAVAMRDVMVFFCWRCWGSGKVLC